MNFAQLAARLRIPVSRILVGVLIVTLLLGMNAWRDVQPVVECVLSILGYGLVGLGLAGRIWSGSYLCGQKTANLVTEGPFSMTRNPLYLFSFLGGLGVALTTESITVAVLFIGCFLAYYAPVIADEEAVLRERHGELYDAYNRAVPRFVPRLALYREPETYVIHARPFRRFLTEVVWFVYAAGLVEMLETLHAAEILPTLWRLY